MFLLMEDFSISYGCTRCIPTSVEMTITHTNILSF